MTPGGIVTWWLENLIKDVGMYETQQSLEDFLPNWSFPQRKGRYAVVNETGTYWTFDGNIWKDTGIMVNSNDILLEILSTLSENQLTRILKQLSALSIRDSGGRQRITIDSIVPSVVIGSGTITTVWTVTTISTLSNITNIWGRSADLQFQTQSRNTFANNTRRHLSYTN